MDQVLLLTMSVMTVLGAVGIYVLHRALMLIFCALACIEGHLEHLVALEEAYDACSDEEEGY